MKKKEIMSGLSNIIRALNNVQIMPGKDNWLNQGGSIAMLEDLLNQINTMLMDKPPEPIEDQEPGK